MLARLQSMALIGIEATACEVEVDVAPRGFEKTSIVGLPDTAVKESLERVHSALNNSGGSWPEYKTVINLAPADIKGDASWPVSIRVRAFPAPGCHDRMAAA